MTSLASDAEGLDADANAALGRGDFARGEKLLRDAIARFGPRADRMALLGQALLRLDRPREAVVALQAAHTARPQAPLLVPLGIALLLSDEPHAAITTLDQATARLPDNAEAWNALALAHIALGNSDQAEAALSRALAIAPRFTSALANICDLLVRDARVDEAIAIAAHAAHANVDDAGAWFKLGHLQMLVPNFDAAREALLQSLAFNPGHAPTQQNLGIVAEWARRFDAAETHYRAALALDPGNADARFGLATILLKQRHADEGWALYAAGKSVPARHPKPRIEARQWQGEPITHGALLIDADQGLGDVLQFIRFAALARARVPRVIVFCDDYYAPLKPLLASMRAIDVVADRESGAHAIAATCLASELPHLLRLGTSAFAPSDAYLAPPAAALQRWRRRVATLPGFKVGVCWSGNPRTDRTDAYRIDLRRSIPRQRLAALAGIPGIVLVSLQKGVTGAEDAEPGPELVDWTPELRDFAETAALIANLDLVVSVDTSIVHCAGATGKEAWMLDRYDNCWRWGDDAEHPGWYRQLRVFRQPTFGDWDSVMLALRRALTECVQNGGRGEHSML